MTTPAAPSDLSACPSAELELSSKIDASQLGQLQTELSTALQGLRFFGKAQNNPLSENPEWHGHWDNINRILIRIVTSVAAMTDSVGGLESGGETRALAAWDLIQTEDAHLLVELKAVRAQVGDLSAGDRKEWNLIASVLESHLSEIHTCAQSLRVKLEELRERQNGAPAVGEAAPPHDNEYRKAALQIEREGHEFAGFTDVIKGLLIWVESPDSRMLKNRSLSV